MSDVMRIVRWRWFSPLIAALVITTIALIPLGLDPLSNTTDFGIYAVSYVIFALGLNIVVGFAGLLDLGYVAFYAIGAYSAGWFASNHFSAINGGKGVYVGVDKGSLVTQQGIHVNFLVLLVLAALIASIGGAIIGLPTLRLRGDYIAIVTLAFGEIAFTIANNGNELHIGKYTLTEGQNAISPIDEPKLPLFHTFDRALSLRGYFWLGLAMAVIVVLINLSLRDSRLGRAWVAIREDEVAAVSMGVPLVRTKLLSYAIGAALGGCAGAYLGTYTSAINATQFKFSFSIFVLAMVILGGLGSIWGTVIGAVILTYIDRQFIPGTLDSIDIQGKLGLNFSFNDLGFGIFGFLLVLLMILRPQGLFPERRRKLELTEGIGSDESVYEARV
ncbi:MAG: branched-chain amino acid transport system permease protein [Thermoleophilaceae bacterium]|nr:branched-chain amino acid transport system permease protein [Thermoleophilaceae bacterium]